MEGPFEENKDRGERASRTKSSKSHCARVSAGFFACLLSSDTLFSHRREDVSGHMDSSLCIPDTEFFKTASGFFKRHF